MTTEQLTQKVTITHYMKGFIEEAFNETFTLATKYFNIDYMSKDDSLQGTSQCPLLKDNVNSLLISF